MRNANYYVKQHATFFQIALCIKKRFNFITLVSFSCTLTYECAMTVVSFHCKILTYIIHDWIVLSNYTQVWLSPQLRKIYSNKSIEIQLQSIERRQQNYFTTPL